MDERRRQRRQQRILEASQSRLSKITGKVYPEKTPSVPEPTIIQQRRNSTDDPSDELGAPEPIHTDPFSPNVFGVPSRFPDNVPNSSFPEIVKEDSSRYWNLAYFMLMTLLALYTVIRERTDAGREQFSSLLTENTFYVPSTSLFWNFAVLEVGLQSARFLLQKDETGNASTSSFLISQLPYPLGSALTVFLRYRLIGTCLIQDITILVFVLGISIVLSTIV
ncbi:unnamed protein product [Rhizopus stolonifer]